MVWWTLRELRMEANKLSVAKLSATAAESSAESWDCSSQPLQSPPTVHPVGIQDGEKQDIHLDN